MLSNAMRSCSTAVLALCLTCSGAGNEGTGGASPREVGDIVELLIADMSLPHEARPEGVPDSYGWAAGPRVGWGADPPPDWEAANMWGQIYPARGGNPALNVRVQVRAPVLLYLSKRDGQWHELQRTPSVEGAAYRQDFRGDENVPADVRREEDGTLSVRLTPGYNYHFWPQGDRAAISPEDIAGLASAFQARLVVDDPDLPDDRDQARIVASCGGDYWRSLSARWRSDWSNNGDWAIGRFRFVTTQWQVFTATTLTPDQIRANPPPLYP